MGKDHFQNHTFQAWHADQVLPGQNRFTFQHFPPVPPRPREEHALCGAEANRIYVIQGLLKIEYPEFKKASF